jgi:ribosomal protein L40E
MAEDLICWSCGAPLAGVSLPMRRLEECPACGVDLHVCRMCWSYDPAAAKRCREPDAEEVKEKERANFCDYFRPRPDAYRAQERAEADASRARLEALFGMRHDQAESDSGPSEADKAREALEDLFGLRDKRDG